MRIEAARRIFNRCRLHEKKCELGTDTFGLMAISYEDPQRVVNFRKQIVFPKQAVV